MSIMNGSISSSSSENATSAIEQPRFLLAEALYVTSVIEGSSNTSKSLYVLASCQWSNVSEAPPLPGPAPSQVRRRLRTFAQSSRLLIMKLLLMTMIPSPRYVLFSPSHG